MLFTGVVVHSKQPLLVPFGWLFCCALPLSVLPYYGSAWHYSLCSDLALTLLYSDNCNVCTATCSLWILSLMSCFIARILKAAPITIRNERAKTK